KACVAVYPSVVQHDIVWVWPNADPQYKDIITKKKPPYIPELDDPSFSRPMGNRDLPFGYEFLIENLMDFAHLPYAHYGIMRAPTPKGKVDREGGRPLDMKVKKLDINGFVEQEWGNSNFIAPCIFHAFADVEVDEENQRVMFIFMCVPVSPGNSRLIWIFPRKFGVWIDQIVPRWIFHIGVNLVLDSDLYLLHVEERKIMEIGATNWQKACFLPTKSDATVVGFRRWFNKYAGGEIDWKGKYSGALPPSPPREQLMDRNGSKSRLFMTLSSSPASTTESIEPPMPELEADGREKKRFDWYSHWYPVMPICDLDKRVPHAKKVLGLDLVVWWDRNENEWKVFDDTCPHRLAPLSDGRIDQWGRLQCVYHGWCFNGNGDCKLIPQAPLDGPP
ncbi:hypothetical protein Golax_023539, partial [Gossypium laxum]|nr:hypothetical protein [Gossypium laxum]